MLRMPIPLLFLLLAIWIGGGAYLRNSYHCCGGVPQIPPLSINDGSRTIAQVSNDNLLFGFSGAAPSMSGQVESAYQKVVDHLNAHPNKQLQLTGWYAAEEQNDSNFDNLGMARAEALKQQLIQMGLPATQLLTTGSLSTNLFFQDQQLYGGIDYRFVDGPALDYFAIQDTNAFTASINDNFTFDTSNFEYHAPLSDSLLEQIERTATYLKENPNRSLRITGLYQSSETNNSAMPSLGLARANNIKSLLTGLGVAATQIDINAQVQDNLAFIENRLTGGAHYEFFATPTVNTDRLEVIEQQLRAQPLVLYFATNAEDIKLSTAQRQYFA
ncbi:MAG: hypothetical protein AAGD05_08935, partial [Bacteroidota bacterium]